MRLEPPALTAPHGCASGAAILTADSGFSGVVALSCAGQPGGLRCDFGSPRTLSSGGMATIGFTLSADASVGSGTHMLHVVGRAANMERSALLTLSVSPVVIQPRGGVMKVSGCAGYVDDVLGPGSRQEFLGAYVGAWQDGSRGSICVQTLARDDGSFELRVPGHCFLGGRTVYWTAGGLETCVSTPFRPGTAHLTLFGRRDRCP